MIFEIGKSYLKEVYNNDIAEAIKQRDGIFWTEKHIWKIIKNIVYLWI